MHEPLNRPALAEQEVAGCAARALAELISRTPAAQRPELTALVVTLAAASPLGRDTYAKLGASLGCGAGAAKRWLARTLREAAGYLVNGGDADALAGRLAFIVEALGRPTDSYGRHEPRE